jgi:hypothetical protein
MEAAAAGGADPAMLLRQTLAGLYRSDPSIAIATLIFAFEGAPPATD